MKKTPSFDLQPVKAFGYYAGKFNYLVLYDYASGNKDRYTVWAVCAEEPVVIGRELPISHCKRVMQDLDALYPKDGWIGNRSTLVRIHNRLVKERKEEFQRQVAGLGSATNGPLRG